jgi:DNA-binding transcriptional MerR regulator
MDELVERVQRALAEEYPGAPNGRVRDLPDRRVIRWYTTTGLVDRPAGLRGRTALYGPRHLLQIVAVKRRQAQGHSLAAIQAELAGAPDEQLAEVARVPDELLATGGPAPDGYEGPVRARFWAATPAREAPSPRASDAATPAVTPREAAAAASGSGEPGPIDLRAVSAGGDRHAAGLPADAALADPGAAPALNGPNHGVAAVGGVALPGGAILVLPGTPTAADRAAIATAAAPLLDLLAQRGLLTTEPLDDRRTP